jgi:hypothetical protein
MKMKNSNMPAATVHQQLILACLVLVLATAAAPAALAAAVTTGASARASDVAKDAGADVLPGVGRMEKRDPSFRENEVVDGYRMDGWELFAENAVRSINTAPRPARERTNALRDMPVPATPENTIPANPLTGGCVPFKPPAPYKSLQEYCLALTKMPWQEAKAMFHKAQAPKDWVGIRGCAVGCVMGDNLWSNTMTFTPFLGASWTGKCIREDKEGNQVEVLQALCPLCGGVFSKRPWSAGVPADLEMAGVTVRKENSWLDAQPTWVFNYDNAKRTYGIDFKAFRDELRMVAPGMAIGTMLVQGTNSTFKSGWNPANHTVEATRFVLLQV